MSIECPEDFEGLAKAGRVVAATLREMAGSVRAGVTTADVDRAGESVLDWYGATPAPRLFYGFPRVNLESPPKTGVMGTSLERSTLELEKERVSEIRRVGAA